MKVFNLPDLGEGLAEAEIREWYIKEGDIVKVDQPLVSMETAKAVVDVPSPYAGKIVKLHGKANEIIKTGAPLITYEITDGEQIKEKGSVVGALEESAKGWAEGEMIIGKAKTKLPAVKAMPAARVLAKELEIDLAQVKGSGPGGLITPSDVKKSIPSKKASVGEISGETLHGVRRTMAQVMTHSHQEVTPVTIIEDADITHFTADADITVLLLQAMCAAVRVEPSLNAWFDGKHLTRQLFANVNIGLAVDSDEGLFVPVIKDAQAKTPSELRAMVATFKQQIKTRHIPATDLHGSTITLSNFGTIAGLYATPIVVPPMVAILACGRFRQKPVIRDGKIVAGKILPLSLTFDHRAVTGGEATRFLGAIINYLQSAA